MKILLTVLLTYITSSAAVAQDTTSLVVDTTYVEGKFYQYTVERTYYVKGVFHREFQRGNHYIEESSVLDDEGREVEFKATRNDGIRHTFFYAYYPSGELLEQKFLVNDTLVHSYRLDESGNRIEVYEMREGNIQHDYYNYKFNDAGQMLRSEKSDSTKKIISAQDYYVREGHQGGAIKYYYYFYSENGLLDYVEINNHNDMPEQTVKYFYADGKLDYTIAYNRKGKELERIEYGN